MKKLPFFKYRLLSALCFSIIACLQLSCKKNDDNGSLGHESENQFAFDCLLKSINEDGTVFIYDENRRIKEIHGFATHKYFTYDSEGKLIQLDKRESTDSISTAYQYYITTDSIVVEKTVSEFLSSLPPSQICRTYVYEIDPNNRLTKESYYGGCGELYFVSDRDLTTSHINGLLGAEAGESLSASPFSFNLENCTIVYSSVRSIFFYINATEDNLYSPLRLITLGEMGIPYFRYLRAQSYCKDDLGNLTNNTTYTYEINEHNFPVKRIKETMGSTATFEDVYEYECD